MPFSIETRINQEKNVHFLLYTDIFFLDLFRTQDKYMRD